MATWNAADGTAINFELYTNASSFEAAGDKETLVLLPGLLGAISSQWRNFVPLLVDQFRIVLIDLRGHGLSENNNTRLDPEQMVEDIIGLMNALEVGTFHVAGYSLGGYLGLQLALTESRRVTTLLMHATKFYWDGDAVAKMGRQLDPDRLSQKTPTYADQLVNEHGAGRWRMLVRQAADLVGYIAESGIEEARLANCPCPVLVSVGDRDELVTLPQAARLSLKLNKGNLLVLPNVRHPYTTLKAVPLVNMMQNFHQAPSR